MYFIGSLSKQNHLQLQALAKQKGISVIALSGLLISAYLSGRLVYAPQVGTVSYIFQGSLPKRQEIN